MSDKKDAPDQHDLDNKESDKRLGMSRSISRRDFLQGVAVSTVATSAGCHLIGGLTDAGSDAGTDAGTDPDAGTDAGVDAGIDAGTDPGVDAGTDAGTDAGPDPVTDGIIAGQDNPSAMLGHRLQGGPPEALINSAVDIGESYDLVVVGAGFGGLAGAWEYKRKSNGDVRILIIDNHNEFGGHARRNTFAIPGGTLIAHGGCYELESPNEDTGILDSVGVNFNELRGFRDESMWDDNDLATGVFYDPRIYPDSGNGQWAKGFEETDPDKFFKDAPMSEQARQELVTLYTSSANVGNLNSMTWEHYLRNELGLGDEAVRFSNLYSMDLVGLGVDVVSAEAGSWYGPGFRGTRARPRLRFPRAKNREDGQVRYPDGMHTVARHFLKALIPDAISGDATAVGIFNGKMQSQAFDSANSPVRLRLGACALQVKNQGNDQVEVVYVKNGGTVEKVSCKGAIVAGWGSAAKHMVPELAGNQLQALAKYRHTAVLYISVLLNHWRPFADLGIAWGYWPGGYFTSFELSDPLKVGSYSPTYHPDKPIVMSIFKYLTSPGLGAEEQTKKARMELMGKSFEDFEREIRTELTVMLGPWGFDPSQDIGGLTINRWAHGYPFFFEPNYGSPYVAGRKSVGRIAFAGADAGGDAWAQAAWNQGIRAAKELL